MLEQTLVCVGGFFFPFFSVSSISQCSHMEAGVVSLDKKKRKVIQTRQKKQWHTRGWLRRQQTDCVTNRGAAVGHFTNNSYVCALQLIYIVTH